MSKLDTIISDVTYILDSLMLLRNIEESGDCNICARKKECEYVPKVGQLVRYNCPFYEKEIKLFGQENIWMKGDEPDYPDEKE